MVQTAAVPACRSRRLGQGRWAGHCRRRRNLGGIATLATSWHQPDGPEADGVRQASVDNNTFTIAAVNVPAFLRSLRRIYRRADYYAPVSVQAKDSFGNNVPNASVVAVESATRNAGQTLTQSTDAGGIATFGNLSID